MFRPPGPHSSSLASSSLFSYHCLHYHYHISIPTRLPVLALSIIGVFFKDWAFFIILGYIFVLSVCLGITHHCCNFEIEDWLHMLESTIMSWLTITNLGRGRVPALFRLVSILYWTIAHTIPFTVILVICITDPGIVNFDEYGKWSELPLVHPEHPQGRKVYVLYLEINHTISYHTIPYRKSTYVASHL